MNQSEKKALCIASVASNLDNFNRSNIGLLQELGYDVTIAAHFSSPEDTNAPEKIRAFQEEMEAAGVHVRQIDFSRSLVKIGQQMRSIRQVKDLLKVGFDLVHCQSPICAAITRACAKKYRKSGKTRVVYTAHGFHFFDGAPLKNWLIYYPVEKRMSRFTDTLVTVNSEDYKRATEKFHAKRIELVHGTGIDLSRWDQAADAADAKELRAALGISAGDIMLLSVGELNQNKNHTLVLQALDLLKDLRLHYVVAGIGPQAGVLEKQASELGLRGRLHLLGFRTDIPALCRAADLFILPSFREGLCVSLMEAIACHTPVIAGRIRGNVDLIQNTERLFDPHSAEELAECVRALTNNCSREDLRAKLKDDAETNYTVLKQYDLQIVREEMKRIYCETME